MPRRIQLNGAPKTVDDGTTVAALVHSLDLQGRRLAVEVNGEVIPRSTHGAHELSDGDRVEVVQAIGGG